jgi:hypothetical protein
MFNEIIELYHSRAFRRFAFCFVAGVALVSVFASLGPAASPAKTSSEWSVYHADPEHLWNRLHEAMFVRVGPDAVTYGHDRLEPLLWARSKHMLEDRSNQRAVALLEEFLHDEGVKLVEDPLKRAVLQRDLWLVFNWLEEEHGKFNEPRLKPEVLRAAQAATPRARHLAGWADGWTRVSGGLARVWRRSAGLGWPFGARCPRRSTSKPAEPGRGLG